MMKILIADDERLVRFSLKSMLEEIGVPPRAIHTARDGQELVDIARRVEPDVAFVDIKMPRLDGLSGIEQARLLSPGTRWVILTSHSSFDYARRAIPLGAMDYLLKPLSPSELARVIDRVGREIRQDLARLNDEFEGRISSILHGTLSLESDAPEFASSARYLGGVLIFDAGLEERALAEKQRECCAEIRARTAAALERNTRIALVTLPEGHIALVCAWLPGPDEQAAVESLRGFLHRMQSVLDSACSPQVRVTQIACGESESFEALLGRFARANELAALRVLLGIGRQIDLAECEQADQRDSGRLLAEALVGVAQAFRDRNRLAYLTHLEQAERLLGEMDRAERDAMEGAVSRFLAASGGFPSGIAGNARLGDAAWLSEMRGIGENLHGEEGRAGELVEQVLEYVRENYMRDIGIGQIAGRLGVTPNYLSSLFHREKGVTFMKHLTRLRMEKARELLSTPGTLVQDAARAVGYMSVRHFSKLFQKQFGVHPSEAFRVEKNAPES
ncbi:MAG: response regulator [Spirochaetia bacterium]|jgi:two-component system response regulator YesN